MATKIRSTSYQIGLQNIQKAKELLAQPEYSTRFVVSTYVSLWGSISIKIGRRLTPKPKRGWFKNRKVNRLAPGIAVFHFEEEGDKNTAKYLDLFGTEEENLLVIKYFDELFGTWRTPLGNVISITVDTFILTLKEVVHRYNPNPVILYKE